MPYREHFPEWKLMDRVEGMSAAELDRLPFGVIELDGAGTILRYNAVEEGISGRAATGVLGKNFFTEVAPCTNVREFAGQFRKGAQEKTLNEVFPYLFDFEMRPTRVWVRLYYSIRTETCWVFVTRRQASG